MPTTDAHTENDCPACNGTTVVTCTECGGSRIEYDDPHERCWACKGSGMEQCGYCLQDWAATVDLNDLEAADAQD